MPVALKKRIRMLKGYQTRKQLFALLFIAPWVIGFLTSTLFPLINAVMSSFSQPRTSTTEGLLLTPVGLANYIAALRGQTDFITRMPDYLKLMFFLAPIIVIFSVVTAVVLNIRLPGRRIFRAIFFLPVILMSGPLFEQIHRIGALEINGLRTFAVFRFIQQELPAILSMPILFVFDNFIYMLWYSGVPILLLLSALQKTDRNIYEAAMVDGASSWQSFFDITLPILKPFILLSTIYTIVELSSSPLHEVLELARLRMFDSGSGFGYSSAVTWLFFLVELLIVLLAFLLLRQRSKKRKEAD